MYTNRGTKLFISVLILLADILTPMSYAHLAMEVFQNGAPFSIDVEPETITAEPGDEIVFSIRIEAEEEFTSSIDLELKVSVLGYNVTFDLGTLNPPFPKEHEVTVNIPSYIPPGNAQGILRGISGEHTSEKNVEITIHSEAEIEAEILEKLEEVEKEERAQWKKTIEFILASIQDLMNKICKKLAQAQKSLMQSIQSLS